jgi:hypothetical protein
MSEKENMANSENVAADNTPTPVTISITFYPFLIIPAENNSTPQQNISPTFRRALRGLR